jgi:NAD(P)H dehydrogenase (quinone)
MKNMADGPFIVTGASGQLAKRTVELMLEANAGPLIATTRTPDRLSDLATRSVDIRRADFDDATSLAKAFEGGKRLLIVSTDALDPGKRFAANQQAIKAALESGIEHIVYTSFVDHGPQSPISFADDHGETEALLASSGVSHSVLRNNMYTEQLLGGAPQAIATGTLVSAAGQGSAGYVTREDCARAAAAALMRERETRTFEISGPALVSQSDVAKILSEISGRQVQYVPISIEELVAAMVNNGLPETIARIYASFDEAISRGRLAVVSNTAEELTGKAPISVQEFLVAHKETLTKSA